jgi:hypothetical protein
MGRINGVTKKIITEDRLTIGAGARKARIARLASRAQIKFDVGYSNVSSLAAG